MTRDLCFPTASSINANWNKIIVFLPFPSGVFGFTRIQQQLLINRSTHPVPIDLADAPEACSASSLDSLFIFFQLIPWSGDFLFFLFFLSHCQTSLQHFFLRSFIVPCIVLHALHILLLQSLKPCNFQAVKTYLRRSSRGSFICRKIVSILTQRHLMKQMLINSL